MWACSRCAARRQRCSQRTQRRRAAAAPPGAQGAPTPLLRTTSQLQSTSRTGWQQRRGALGLADGRPAALQGRVARAHPPSTHPTRRPTQEASVARVHNVRPRKQSIWEFTWPDLDVAPLQRCINATKLQIDQLTKVGCASLRNILRRLRLFDLGGGDRLVSSTLGHAPEFLGCCHDDCLHVFV